MPGLAYTCTWGRYLTYFMSYILTRWFIGISMISRTKSRPLKNILPQTKQTCNKLIECVTYYAYKI